MLPFFASSQNLDEKIPFDENVKTGKLSNGLTYFIQKNAKPEKKVDLRLIIKAGSILETDEQQGLAHFMEHMCFNGTKRFPKNQLVDYLQSIGVKFGQHLNAYTSFDETVYFLPIPSDKPEKVEKGFQILEDWAFNATLTPEEVDKERGVVLEEYRLGLGAEKRMMNKYLPKMMHKSHYANRLPIGKEEVLKNFTYDKLKSFYKDWYRPNLMAVVVVGDIDVAEMEKKIKDHFSSYKNPKKEKERKTFEVPNHKETFISIESDKEATNTQVRLLYKDEGTPKSQVTIGDLKNALVENLFSSMLNNRLQEKTNEANPPYVFGFSYHGNTYANTKEAYQSFAMTKDNGQIAALKVLVEENERVKKFGFNQSEFERAKKEFLAYMESQLKDKDKQESDLIVDQIQQYYLESEPMPSIEWSFKTTKDLMASISLEQVNSYIKPFIKNENRVVILTGPEKAETIKPTEKEVLEALQVDFANLKNYEDKVIATSLIRKDIKAGSIKSKSKNDKTNVITWVLSNGAIVKYKKTDFKNEQILFQAISFGGTNLYSNEEHKKTNFATGGLNEAGVAGMTQNDLSKFMAGKIAYARSFMTSTTEEIAGESTPKDLETLMQLIYCQFTDLNYDEKAFESFKQKQNSMVNNIASNPSNYFNIEFSKFQNEGNSRFYGTFFATDKEWAFTDYKVAYQKRNERFANAADFEFYFVGNIDETNFEALVSKYIASLPTNNAPKETAKDVGFRPTKGSHKKIFYKGSDPKSSVQISMYGDIAYNEKDILPLKATSEILQIKLTERLRETESGVYTVRATSTLNKVPYGNYSINVSFPCGPDNAEKLLESALAEIKKIADNGPEAKDVAKFKEMMLLDYKKNMKENKYWLDNLTKSYKNGSNHEGLLNEEAAINALTAKDIQDVAKKYFTKDKVIGILMPEKK
ncbi:peptidase M16 [bacterium 336/3]|nr:peptidase M16 [bacterium 336/3]